MSSRLEQGDYAGLKERLYTDFSFSLGGLDLMERITAGERR